MAFVRLATLWAAALIAAVPVPDEEDQQTAGEWLLAEQMHMGQLVHQRAEAVDELSLLQAGLTASPRVTQTAFFDVSIGGIPTGRIQLGLFGEVTPRTVENFVGLVRGGRERNGRPLHYKGSSLHRIIPGFMLQGGDFTVGDGTGGDSLQGGTFADENFRLSHSEAGRLSMANYGPDTNRAQFFITTVPTPHLDGKHVVFGQVVGGMAVVAKVEAVGTASGRPTARVLIEDCGVDVEEGGTSQP